MRLFGQFYSSLLKSFTSTKSSKRLQASKNKKMLLKTSKGKIVTCSLISVLCFCLGVFMPFGALVLLVRGKSFCKKKKNNNKEFKTALITSFTLLLKLSYYKYKFFNHNPFQLSQSVSIITIFLSSHNLF